MGTRNLIVIKHENEYKVVKYCQWDGYPEGQGAIALGFIRKMDKNLFVQSLKNIKYISSDESHNYSKHTYPQLYRDDGADILSRIYNAQSEFIFNNSDLKFAADSLFCEWLYLLDLDKDTFNVFKGFQKSPLLPTEEFYWLSISKPEDDEYFPVKLLKSFSLDECKHLTNETFAKEIYNLINSGEE